MFFIILILHMLVNPCNFNTSNTKMFDFLAHWFAKTEIVHNEKGEPVKQPPRSLYKNGHFSLDLTFLVLIVIAIIAYFGYMAYRKYLVRKVKALEHKSKDVELQQLRLESHVVCAPNAPGF
jgi:hypothetical protein